MADKAKKTFEERLKDKLIPAVYAALNTLGKHGSDKMKEALETAHPFPAVFSRGLVDSITYGMKGTKQTTGFPGNSVNPGNPNLGETDVELEFITFIE